MKASKDCSALCLTAVFVRPRVVPAWHTATGDNMGRTAASAEKKEFARQFASVVVVPTGWLNDMVARSGCAEYCQFAPVHRARAARAAHDARARAARVAPLRRTLTSFPLPRVCTGRGRCSRACRSAFPTWSRANQ